MAGEYNIKWSHDQNGGNPLKPRFVIKTNTVNGPSNGDVDTPLLLPGRFSSNYGQNLAQSYVWLLENFSSPNEPSPTTSGMLWYDSANEVVKVRNTNNNDWIEMGSGGGSGDQSGVLHLLYDIEINDWDAMATAINNYPGDVVVLVTSSSTEDGLDWYLPENGINITGDRHITFKLATYKIVWSYWPVNGCQISVRELTFERMSQLYTMGDRTEPCVLINDTAFPYQTQAWVNFIDTEMYPDCPFVSTTNNSWCGIRAKGSNTFIEGGGDYAFDLATGWGIDIFVSEFAWVGYFEGRSGGTGKYEVHMDPTAQVTPNDDYNFATPPSWLRLHLNKYDNLHIPEYFAPYATKVSVDEDNVLRIRNTDNTGWILPVTGTPLNTTSTTINVTKAHMGKFVRLKSSNAVTVNVPAEASIDFEIGSEIHFRAVTDGGITFVPAAGVTINAPSSGGLNMTEAGATATLKKVDVDEWDLFGLVVA